MTYRKRLATQQMKITDQAYAHLADLVDHPYKRADSRPLYTGTGIYPAQPSSLYNTTKGLSQYLDTIAQANQHPRTFSDTRPEHMRNDLPLATPNHHTATEYRPQWNYVPYSPTLHPWAWHPVLPTTHGPHGTCHEPCCAADPAYYVQATPYRLDMYGDWCTYELDPEHIHPRMLSLAQATLDYFISVAVWWRIPPRSVALSLASDPTKRSPQSSGPNPNVARVAAVLEAIGLQWLTHELLQPQPHRTRYELEQLNPNRPNWNIGSQTT